MTHSPRGIATCALLVAIAVMAACAQVSRAPDSRATSAPDASQQQTLDPGFRPRETVSEYGPDTVTRDIVQDSHGDIWFATFSGVIRYDGHVFTNVTNEAPLQPTRAFSLLRDRDDNIWIGTAGAGVYRYDGTTYTQITARDGLANDQVLSMMEDRDGNLWFGHHGAGATRYDGNRFTHFGAQDGFTDDDVSSMTQDQTGRIWFGTREGLFHYDGESFAIFDQARHLPRGGFIPTLVDGKGDLWFGGKSGLHRFDGTALRQITHEPVWGLDEGSDGSIWFGGDDGALQRIGPASFVGFLEPQPEIVDAGSPRRLIFDILEDRDGVLWIGTFGLARLDDGKVRHLGPGTTASLIR